MVICNMRQLIFIHIPKTGGTTVEKRLKLTNLNNLYSTSLFENNRTLQHMTWDKYVEKYPEKFKYYKTFSMVRNPYCRFISSYNWFPPQTGMGKLSGQTLDQYINIVAWHVLTKEFNKTPFHEHHIPQWKYVCDEDGKLMIDTLFKQEKYHEVDMFLEKELGCNNKDNYEIGPRHNIVLTKKQKKQIHSLYKKDFEIFGYEKGF